MNISVSLSSFMTKWYVIQKIIQTCFLSFMLILIMMSQSKFMEFFPKYKMNISITERDFPWNQKKYLSCASNDYIFTSSHFSEEVTFNSVLVSCSSHILLLSILLKTKTDKRAIGFALIRNSVERYWEHTWGIFQAIKEGLNSRVRF